MDAPGDRNSDFEPKIVTKYQRDVSGIEEKVISLYARGMSTRDIHDQLKDLCGFTYANNYHWISKFHRNFNPTLTHKNNKSH